MQLQTPGFLIFLVSVFVIFWVTTRKWRWITILFSSLIFYASFVPAHLLILGISVATNYLTGILIDKTVENRNRKLILAIGIILNLMFLAIFKYLNLFSDYIPEVMQMFRDHFPSMVDSSGSIYKLIIPIGISFYTLSVISYLIEVKRKRIEAERHPGYFACYVIFFPKVLMGPLEPPTQFLSQIRRGTSFNYNLAVTGLQFILWGLLKKLVVVNRISLAVDAVYSAPGQFPGPTIVMSTILYAFQIYFDFSAYTDIARGAGALLGFRMSQNFNNPYGSTSIREFWTRWHMSLSVWLRDYIFLPVAYYLSDTLKNSHYYGIKTEKIVYTISITITFLICGMWHGAGWNFIIWGLLFAVYLSTARLVKNLGWDFKSVRSDWLLHYIITPYQVILTFTLVCFTWVFFRTSSPGDAFGILSGMGRAWYVFTDPLQTLRSLFIIPGIPTRAELEFTYLSIVFVLITEYLWLRTGRWNLNEMPMIIRWSIYILITLFVVSFSVFGNQFIYQQF